MKYFRRLTCAFLFFLTACQPHSALVTVIDGDQTYRAESNEDTLSSLLAQMGIILGANDRVLVNGMETSGDQLNLQEDSLTIQIRRAATLTLVTPQGQQTLETSALTVGEALNDAGLIFTRNDLLDPPAETPITQPLTVTFTPARDLTIFVGDSIVNVRSAAGTVGEALAEAGIPLVGLDISSPPENEAPPPDGQIRVMRVYETTEVALEPIPFTEQVTYSPDVPFGQKETIQPGVDGIAMTRSRIRYEDRKEVSRETETKTVMREPQTRIVQSGEKIVLAPVGGNIPYDYWFATEMYATVYSPCESGTGGCSYGTASGARAGQGVVAVDYSIYSYLAGMQVYIPGYGVATIGDTGGGPIIETAFGVPRTKWIDLGFNEGEMRDMTGWVTVYFLAPAPAEIPYFLK
jgi:resuscitation-promoting factor RpfB